jgi:cytoskeletal protein RodZ
MIPKVAAIIDSIYNGTSFFFVLIFVLPLFYLLLQQLPRQPKVPTTSTTVATPSDSKDNKFPITDESSATTTPRGIKSDDLDDDVILSPNKNETTNETSDRFVNNTNNGTSAAIPASATTAQDTDQGMDLWKCNCFAGQQFLPKSIFGNMEAVLKMGTGECYHSS